MVKTQATALISASQRDGFYTGYVQIFEGESGTPTHKHLYNESSVLKRLNRADALIDADNLAYEYEKQNPGVNIKYERKGKQ
jgi:hypothetical protein